tara:strand:+ start:594 stop:1175 length:582 start_codon:yes stop_codon:yes gene_type:complete
MKHKDEQEAIFGGLIGHSRKQAEEYEDKKKERTKDVLESAPKDGTNILVFSVDYNAWELAFYREGAWYGSHHVYSKGNDLDSEDISAWMYQPKKPQDESKQLEEYRDLTGGPLKMTEKQLLAFMGRTVRLSNASIADCYWYYTIELITKNKHDYVEFRLSSNTMLTGYDLINKEFYEYLENGKWHKFKREDFL